MFIANQDLLNKKVKLTKNVFTKLGMFTVDHIFTINEITDYDIHMVDEDGNKLHSPEGFEIELVE